MAPILSTTFQVFVLNKNVCIFHQISLKFDYSDPVGNKSTLVQLMAWHFFSTMPLTNGDLWYCQYYWSPIYSFWPGLLSVLKSVAIDLLNDAFGLDNELSCAHHGWWTWVKTSQGDLQIPLWNGQLQRLILYYIDINYIYINKKNWLFYMTQWKVSFYIIGKKNWSAIMISCIFFTGSTDAILQTTSRPLF